MSNNFHQTQHEMRLEKTHPSGAEEWGCPTCGRRFVVTWPPKYKKIILQVGDEYAAHSGGKGGLQMGVLEVNEVEEPELSDELRAALDEALENVDFDWISADD